MEANKTILQMKYARIVAIFAEETGVNLEDALSFFYNSDTYKLISEESPICIAAATNIWLMN